LFAFRAFPATIQAYCGGFGSGSMGDGPPGWSGGGMGSSGRGGNGSTGPWSGSGPGRLGFGMALVGIAEASLSLG